MFYMVVSQRKDGWFYEAAFPTLERAVSVVFSLGGNPNIESVVVETFSSQEELDTFGWVVNKPKKFNFDKRCGVAGSESEK